MTAAVSAFLFQTVIGSVGGVELLYPILEQVHLPVRKRAESTTTAAGDHLKAAAEPPAFAEGGNPSPYRPPLKESPTAPLDVAWWFDGMCMLCMQCIARERERERISKILCHWSSLSIID